jgi:hypothetical protein
MSRYRSMAIALAAAAMAVSLATGCQTVSKATSCSRLIDDAADAAALAAQGDVSALTARSDEFATQLRDAADNATDPEAAAAMTGLAQDLEQLRDVDVNQPLDPQTSQLMNQIPASVDALTQACTNF